MQVQGRLSPGSAGAARQAYADADPVPATRAAACAGCQTGVDLFPFTMAFQPIVDLETHSIIAHEALVRGPEGQGAAWVLAQVTTANLYAFDQACRVKAIEMAARLAMPGRLSINFLPNAVYEPRACIRATLDAAARTGFDPGRLTFEVIETEAIAESGHLAKIVTEYRRQGFKVALDDFGTGYSGLSRLADLQPDTIKLDRCLVADCDQDHRRLAIIGSMVALGAALGITVIMEGVERASEADALRSVGGRFMQGYLFSRPIFESYSSQLQVFGRP